MATETPTSLPPERVTSPTPCRNLTFSIAKIMEPDKRLTEQNVNPVPPPPPALPTTTATTILQQPPNITSSSYSAHLKSAFEKYVPTLRHQDLLQHYPVLSKYYPLYYPSPLLRAFPGPPASTPSVTQNSPPPTTIQEASSRLSLTNMSSENPRGKKSPAPRGELGAATKQKTFTCPECGKVFNAHYNLTRHMPVHTGARPNFDLKKHMRKLHDAGSPVLNGLDASGQSHNQQSGYSSVYHGPEHSIVSPFILPPPGSTSYHSLSKML
ncbi:hypothetical protein DMN91_012667 [Ooceraea biroi]|uniref:C2H2-type domain-containing protein n=1 Tax=Ooceraea biroi TaxID=2015173 RepID=A0A3L8D317_OOCBI|nr:hypothetical protein DMN91_012667 [Ooceraea biroi]